VGRRCAGKVQDYLTTKRFAQTRRTRSAVGADIGQTKNNLVSMVKNDPGSAALRSGWCQTMIDGLTAEQRPTSRYACAAGQRYAKIAHNAITSLAVATLTRPGCFKGDLEYLVKRPCWPRHLHRQPGAVHQSGQRGAQPAARPGPIPGQLLKGSTYLNSMVHPQTGDVYMPPRGLGVAVMNDPAVATSTRAAVHDVYTRMAERTAPGTSDPMVRLAW